MVLERLELKDMELLAQRAEKVMDRPLPLTATAREAVLEMADGDGRSLLNTLEQCFTFEWGRVRVGLLEVSWPIFLTKWNQKRQAGDLRHWQIGCGQRVLRM